LTRRIAVIVLGIVMALGVAPAAQAEDGPCGQAPGPHCRPMDCEIVWTEAQFQSPDLPTIMVPQYKCYM
jgi:hypothetical protein